MSCKITRRRVLRGVAAVGAGLLAAGCRAVPTPQVVEVTKVVEKQVTQQVEKQVTQVVEKVVTATPAPRLVSAPGSLPIVKSKVTLKIMINFPRDITQNVVAKWLRDQTNVDTQYIVATGPEAQQKLSLAVASGDLPDVFQSFQMSLSDQQVLAEQKVLIPLDDLVEEYGFECKRMFKDQPNLRKGMSLIDGKLYGMPAVAVTYHMSAPHKMWVYKPWLDKLSIKMPATTDEFFEMLKAFKTKDPNGNGKADEIPLSGVPSSQGGFYSLEGFLMQSFVFNERFRTRSLMVEGGVIKASYAEPGWREGLKYLNKLWAEGLIDPQVFSNKREQLMALGENPGVPILGAAGGNSYSYFTQAGGTSGRSNEFVAVPPLKGPTGLQQTPQNPDVGVYPGTWLITKACKNAEVAFRFCDFMYSWEASQNIVFGMQGLDWRPANPGEVGINGGPAKYAMLRAWASDPNTYMNCPPYYQTAADRGGVLDDPKNPLEKRLFDATAQLYIPYGVKDKVVPFLVFTAAQSKDISQLTTPIENFVEQAFAEFVTGKRNPDRDWDAYLKQLKDLGLDKFLKLYQDAYTAKMKS